MSQLRLVSPVLWVCILTLPSISSCSKQERNYDTNEGGPAGSSEAGAAGNDVGGKSSTGGKSATGGRASTGGAVSNGGTPATGGTVSNGGTSVNVGGNSAVGGTSTRTTTVCQTPADCSDGDPCNGVETCSAGTCAKGTPACVNPDANHCICVAAAGACSLQPKDVDKDGYGDALCPGTTGNDCDDTQTTVHPTATEVCDGMDNDCNGKGDIEDGLPLSGVEPASPYSSNYLGASMYQKLYGSWVESMKSYYFVSSLGLQRVNRDGTVNGSTVTLTTKNTVTSGSPSYGVLGGSVGETVGLLYTYGSGPSDAGFSIIGRGGDNIGDAWILPWSLYLAGDSGNYAGGFISAVLIGGGTTPSLRLRPFSANGNAGNQLDEAIADAGGVQVAGSATNLGVLVTPNAAAGSLQLRLFDGTLTLQRKITVGTGPGVLGIRDTEVAVAYKEGANVKFQVWSATGSPVCSMNLSTTIPWAIKGSGKNWHVVFASGSSVKPTLEVISASCKHIDSAQLLDTFSINATDRGEAQYITSGKGSVLVWRNGYSPTSYNVQARFFGDPLCQTASNN